MNEQITQWIAPVIFVLAGYGTGRIFERVIVGRLKRLAMQTAWKGDEIIIDGIGSMPTLWLILAGFYGALETMPPVRTELSGVFKTLLLITLIASVTIVISRIAVRWVNIYVMQMRGVLPSTTIFSNLTRTFIYIVGILVILETLEIKITPLLGALGVGGLAVALALQDTLSNLFAGLQIIGSGQLKQGEFIRLESGEEGYVMDVTWRNTTIRQLSNNMVIVPNSHLAKSRVTNFDRPDKEQAVAVQVGVSYDSDLQVVERVCIEVAREVMQSVAGGIPHFEPIVRYHTFGDSSINFSVVMRGQQFVDQYLIKHEFIKRLHERFSQERITIPYPMRTVHLKMISDSNPQ